MADSSTEDLTFHTLIKKVMDTDANVSVVRLKTRERHSDSRNVPTRRRTRSSETGSPSVMLRNKMKDKLKRTSSASKRLTVRRTSLKKAAPAPLISIDTEDTPRTILKHITQTEPEVPLVISDRIATKEIQLDSRLEMTQTSAEQSLLDLSESKTSNIIARPKKNKKMLSLAQFQKGLSERIQRYQEMKSSKREEANMNVSLPGNSSDLTRSFKLVPESLGDPESVGKKGLVRRPKKRRMINVEDFEQRVEQNFQMLKGEDRRTQEALGMSKSALTNQSAMTRSFKLDFDTPEDPESVEKKGLTRKPRKHRIVNLENFEGAVEQNFQQLKGGDMGRIQGECSMSSSALTNQSSMMRSLMLGLDTPDEPESVEQKGLTRRTRKHRIINMENFEGGVEHNFQQLKGSQECFIEPSLTVTDRSIAGVVLFENETDIVLSNTALYVHPMSKEQNLQDCSPTTTMEPQPRSLSREEVPDGDAMNKFDVLSSDLDVSKAVSKAVNEKPLPHEDDQQNDVTMEDEVEERVDDSKNGTFDMSMEKEAQMDLNEDDLIRPVLLEGIDLDNIERMSSSYKETEIITSTKLHDFSQAISFGTSVLAIEELDDNVFQSLGAASTLPSAPPSKRLQAETETSALQESKGTAETEDNKDMNHAEGNLQTHDTEFELIAENEGKEYNKLVHDSANKLATYEEEDPLSENILMQQPDPEEEEGDSASRMLDEDAAFDTVEEIVVVSEDAEPEEPINKTFEMEDSTSKLEGEVDSSFEMMNEEKPASEALEKEEHTSSEFEDEESSPKYVVEGFNEQTEEKDTVEEPTFEEEQKVEEIILEGEEERGMQTHEEEYEALFQMEVPVAGSEAIKEVFQVEMESIEIEETPEGEQSEIPKINAEENDPRYEVEERSVLDKEEPVTDEVETEPTIEEVGEPNPEEESFDQQTHVMDGLEDQEVENISLEEVEVGEQTHEDAQNDTLRQTRVVLVKSKTFEMALMVQKENPEQEGKIPNKMEEGENASTYEVKEKCAKMEEPASQEAELETSVDVMDEPCPKAKSFDEQTQENGGVDEPTFEEEQDVEDSNSGALEEQTHEDEEKETHGEMDVVLVESEEFEEVVEVQKENSPERETSEDEEEEFPKMEVQTVEEGAEETTGRDERKGSSPVVHSTPRKKNHPSGTMSSQQSEKSSPKEGNPTETSPLRKVEKSSSTMQSSSWTDDDEEEENKIRNVEGSFNKDSLVSSPDVHAVFRKTILRSGTMSSQQKEKSAPKEGNRTATSTQKKVEKSSHSVHKRGWTDDEEEDNMRNTGESFSKGSLVSSPAVRAVFRKTSQRSGTMSSQRKEKSATKESNRTASRTQKKVEKSSHSVHKSGWTDGEEEDHMRNAGESVSRGAQITSHSMPPALLGQNRRSGSEWTSYIQKSAAEGGAFSKAHRHTMSKSRASIEQSDVMEDEDGEQSTDEEDALTEELTMDRNDFLHKKKEAVLSSTLTTPHYLKPSSAKVTKNLKIAKGAPKKNVLPKREPHLPRSLIRQTFVHYAKMKVAKDTYEVVEKGVNTYLEQLSADLETFAAHAGRTTVEASDVELLMRRQGLVTDEMPMNVLIERYMPLEYRKLLIPIAISGNKVVLQ